MNSIQPLELNCNRLTHIPLESLHIGIKVTIPSLYLQGKSSSASYVDNSEQQTTSTSSSSFNGSTNDMNSNGDIPIGHCTIDLYRVCKTAVNRYNERYDSNQNQKEQEQKNEKEKQQEQEEEFKAAKRHSTGRIDNTMISIARQLIKEGVPLYCIDISTMEVRHFFSSFSFLACLIDLI